jgi:DNA-binding response OmpR family regulator
LARRILIVDDEPEIVDLLRDVLVAEGFHVDAASDATGTLDLVRAHICDGAILDFNLPDMNGVMLHRQIRPFDVRQMLNALRGIFDSGGGA